MYGSLTNKSLKIMLIKVEFEDLIVLNIFCFNAAVVTIFNDIVEKNLNFEQG